MSTDTPNPTTTTDTESIKRELNTVLPGSDPLENLTASQTGPVHYTVLSARNGSVTTHRVNIQKVTCSCEDMTYNTNATPDDDGGRDVCAHLAYVMTIHPQLSAEEAGLLKHLGLMQGADELMRDLDNERSRIEELLVEMRDAQAGQQAASADGGGSGSGGSSNTGETDTGGSDANDEDPDTRVWKAMRDTWGLSDSAMDKINTWTANGHVKIEIDGYVDDDGLGAALFKNDLVQYNSDQSPANSLPISDVDDYCNGGGQ